MRHARLRRDGIRLEHLDALEQRGHARGRFAVTEVGLDTPHRNGPVGWPPVLEEAPNGTHLCRVSNLSARSMHLNVRDVVRMHVCIAQDLSEESLLRARIRGRDGRRIARVVPPG